MFSTSIGTTSVTSRVIISRGATCCRVGRMFWLCLCVPWLFVVRVIRMIPCTPKLPFVKRNRAFATDGTEVQSYESAVGLAVLDDEGLFRIHACGRHVLWIPDSDKQLQVRLMICAHMRDAGHRGVAATLVRLQRVLCLVRYGGSNA